MKHKILIKGAGDIATGIGLRLYRSGLRFVMTELDNPLTVRRTVAFSSCMKDGFCEVEGVKAKRIELTEFHQDNDHEFIPVVCDAKQELIKKYKWDVVIDATLIKTNPLTSINDGDFVIGIGPGFEAQKDCNAIVETHRGHGLGRVLYSGSAFPNTGVPGVVGGKDHQRVLRAPCEGVFVTEKEIGNIVKEGDIVASVKGSPVKALTDGIIRGLLRTDTYVKSGLKVGDVDPRNDVNFFLVSDKALAVGGGVLEAVMANFSGKK